MEEFLKLVFVWRSLCVKLLIQTKILILKQEVQPFTVVLASNPFGLKLDGVGPDDNRPSTDKLHHFVKKK